MAKSVAEKNAEFFEETAEMLAQEAGSAESVRHLERDSEQNGFAEEKKPRGRPFPKGMSGNPGGKPNVREAVEDQSRPGGFEIDPEGGAVTAARMQKAMSQSPEADAGPTERELRRWLDKAPGDYVKRMRESAAEEEGVDELKAEVCKLREQLAEERKRNEASVTDEGSARSEAILEEWFSKYEVPS